MIIINKNKDVENHISVKIENFGSSPLIKKFNDNAIIEDVIGFLKDLDFDMRSSAIISVFCDDKILILRS